ncbi:hypothetical protein ACTWP5_27710 [Streptomyces sp. 4N509B]|uniref:hypothetical protein n=1 Tax=Streptomyces sp. 4N509B TaxID=3457413 RepID=UPI003FD0A6E5
MSNTPSPEKQAEQAAVIEGVRAYNEQIGPIDPTNAGQLLGHLMGAEVLLAKVAKAFEEPKGGGR